MTVSKASKSNLLFLSSTSAQHWLFRKLLWYIMTFNMSHFENVLVGVIVFRNSNEQTKPTMKCIQNIILFSFCTDQLCTHWYASSRPESSHSSEVLLLTFKGNSQHSGVGVTELIVVIDECNTPLIIRQALQKTLIIISYSVMLFLHVYFTTT